MNKEVSILWSILKISNKFSSRSHKLGIFMISPNHFTQFHHRFFPFHNQIHGIQTYKTFEEVSHAK